MNLSESRTLALNEQHLQPLLYGTVLESLQFLYTQAHKMQNQAQHFSTGRHSFLDKVRTVPIWQPLLTPRVDP